MKKFIIFILLFISGCFCLYWGSTLINEGIKVSGIILGKNIEYHGKHGNQTRYVMAISPFDKKTYKILKHVLIFLPIVHLTKERQ